MKLLLPAAALLFVSLSARASDTFERTLSVSSQPDLYVSTGSGNIRIFPGGGGQIKVVGHVHSNWNGFGGGSGDVNERIRRIVSSPPITQSSNSIHVGQPEDRSLYNNITIDYEVTVPDAVALNLHSGSGDLEVDNVGRFLAASSGSGAVRAHQLHGPADLHTGSGDIELEDTATGDVKAQTGSGSIRVHGFSGAFNARTGSGDIEGDGHLEGMSSLTSGSGSVRLHLTPESHFHFEASTGSGSIRLHMPGAQETDDSRHHLTSSVNGGGPPLTIHTGSGDIEVTPR